MKRVLALLLCSEIVVFAQVPTVIGYNGRVQAAGRPFSGMGEFKMALVDAKGLTTLWSNDGTSMAGSEPKAVVNLSVTNGLFSVMLGDEEVRGMQPILPSVFAAEEVWLRVWFNDGTHGFQQLVPDQRLGSAGYAMKAAMAETLEGFDPTVFASRDHTHTELVSLRLFEAEQKEAAVRDEKVDLALEALKASDTTLTNDVQNHAQQLVALASTAAGLQSRDNQIEAKLTTLQTETTARDTQLSAETAAVESELKQQLQAQAAEINQQRSQITETVSELEVVQNRVGGSGEAVTLNAGGRTIARLETGLSELSSDLRVSGGNLHLDTPGIPFPTVYFSKDGAPGWSLQYDQSVRPTAYPGFRLRRHDTNGVVQTYMMLNPQGRLGIGHFSGSFDDAIATLDVRNTNDTTIALFRGYRTTGTWLEIRNSPRDASTAEYRLGAREGQFWIAGQLFSSGFAPLAIFDAENEVTEIRTDLKTKREVEFEVGTDRRLVVRNDGNIAPGLMVDTAGPLAGIMRFRNILEVWPNDAGTTAGKIDVRNKSGAATIILNGDNGTVTATTLTPSDRNIKERFAPVNPREVLAKVATMPVTLWSYKDQPETRHIGPVAQEFHEAFGLGTDNRHIASVDADGVAFAAIQGLHEALAEKDEKIRSLEERLLRLEKLLEDGR